MVLVPAAGLQPDKPIRAYVHESWGPEDGLPQISVQTMAQTADGYVWLGTQEGLARFDGARIVVFDRSNTDAFSANFISSLVVGQGGLWIGVQGGGVMRYLDGEFRAFGSSEGLDSDVVLALAESPGGEIWVGTDVGLNRLDDGQVTSVTDADGKLLGRIDELMVDSRGVVWAARGEHGVLQYQASAPYTRVPGEPILKDRHVFSLHEDNDGSVLMGTTTGGIWRARGESVLPVREPLLRGATVKSILRDSGGNLWAGTLYRGVIRINEDGAEPFSIGSGLSNEHVYSLMEDAQGGLWLGTAGGVDRMADSLFRQISSIDGLASDDVWSIFQGKDGSLWVGSNAGLNLIVDDQPAPFPGAGSVSGHAVMAILEDREGTLWLGTYGGGVKRLTGEQRSTLTTEDGLASNVVYAIVEARDGTLWFGTRGGLSRLREGELTTLGRADGLPHELVRAIHEDEDGTVWVGTEGGGVARVDNDTLLVDPAWAGLTANQRMINGVLSAKKGLWLSTSEGLVHLGAGGLTPITSRHGLADEVVYRMLRDGLGGIWMSGNKGISRVDESQLEEFLSGARTEIDMVTYGRAQGMPASECNGGSQPSGWRTTDGRLWFPTVAGVVYLDPAEMAEKSSAPPILLESVRIDERDMAVDEEALLPAGTGRLEFRYTSPTFLGPEEIRFRIRLSPLDTNWTEGSAERGAVYSHLPPGSYEFAVTACNGEDACNEAPAVYRFAIQPYFYETRTFRVLAVLALVVLLVTLPAVRIRRLRHRERSLQRAVDKRTAELREMAEELKELSLSDPLTGLRNRRYLFETVPPLLDDINRRRRAIAEGRKNRGADEPFPVAGVFMVDIDHFKRVNDELGHDAGDTVLRQFSAVLKSQVRLNDVVVRWGGEEFLVVLSRTQQGSVLRFAERLRAAVEATEFMTGAGPLLRKTCSVGCVGLPFFDDPDLDLDLEQAVQLADAGLYMAKEEGRNRCVMIQAGSRRPTGAEQVRDAVSSVDDAVDDELLTIYRP